MHKKPQLTTKNYATSNGIKIMILPFQKQFSFYDSYPLLKVSILAIWKNKSVHCPVWTPDNLLSRVMQKDKVL